MNIKMIVSDMDGTLLKDVTNLSEVTIETLKECHEQGIIIVIATGRPFQMVKQFISDLEFIEALILYNGSAIYCPKTKEILMEEVLAKHEVKDVLTYCKKHNTEHVVYCHDHLYVEGNNRINFYKEVTKEYPDENKPNILPITSIDDIAENDKVNKIMIIEPDREKYHVYKEAVQHLGEFEITESHHSYIDINPNTVNKRTAIEFLENKFKIDKSEIIAFGDQENDISMLKHVAYPVAVDNAIDEVKQIAKYITDSNFDDGVAKALKKYVLNSK